MLRWIKRLPGPIATLGIFPGAFNPPTAAHLALAEAALSRVDQVLFVLPQKLPHKDFSGATFLQRRQLLAAALHGHPRLAAATSQGGLFIEIAHECRQEYGSAVLLYFLCGADAAERIVNWDYGKPGDFAKMLGLFGLLVAPRQTEYQPPAHFTDRIRPLPLDEEWQRISATDVRHRIRTGESWEHLVPAAIVPQVRAIYS